MFWFEIPCGDFERGKRFYETILGVTLQDVQAPGTEYATFPADRSKGELGGAIVAAEGHVPSTAGTVVYLNAGPDLQVAQDRVEPAGGKVVLPKTQVPMEDWGLHRPHHRLRGQPGRAALPGLSGREGESAGHRSWGGKAPGAGPAEKVSDAGRSPGHFQHKHTPSLRVFPRKFGVCHVVLS